MPDLLVPQVDGWQIALRTAAIYVVVLVLLRLAGKRELGQMTPFDLVVILLISNAVQNAMTGPDTSLTGGVVAAATLIVVKLIVSRFGRRLGFLARAFSASPTLLVNEGNVIASHLRREDVSVAEIEMAAREHSVEKLEDVRAAILEIDGSISIIPMEGTTSHRTMRRFRQLKQRP